MVSAAPVESPRTMEEPDRRVRVDGPVSRRPRILFINQYYWPDHASTAQHLTDLAEFLAARGYDCEVLCARGTYEPGRPAPPLQEVRNGVTIRRARATSLGRSSTWRRMTDYLSFYVSAAFEALKAPRPDVVVSLTTPPIIGLLGLLLRRLRGCRHVCWSMDLHPDASLALGRMSPRNPVVALLKRLSDAVVRQADQVVALGPYMADRLKAKGVRASRLVEIPVWSRADEIELLPRENHSLRKSLGLADRFVVMYSGNLGFAHSAAEFLEAARRLRARPDILFLFVGGGPRMNEVRDARRLEGLENIRLMDYVPREQLGASLSMADAHLVSMRSEMTGIVVPGKLYGIMASGRPALFVGPAHCETADTIRQADCGQTVRLGDADALVEAITALADQPALAATVGQNGRAAFLEEFERAGCCARWAGLIDALLGRDSIGQAPVTPRAVERRSALAQRS